MAFPWLLLAGAALGLGKHGVDSKNRNKFIKGESERAKWAPWTGHEAKVPEQGNWLAALTQGAVTGALMDQQGLFDAKKPNSLEVTNPEWLSDGGYKPGMLGVNTDLGIGKWRGLAGG